ncbi:hypothetical protein BDM02DRAFT_2841164 [Thelephora ganbajun]|uniref:Uncharacterized protein n=1 Tax=Thelephora ganbajun TaxID=370292 RepID=A0ACB6ZBI1_THEGA|nr:hypothetical protein BDM02DRAFT_2841164 [Thelephora ganbajun]
MTKEPGWDAPPGPSVQPGRPQRNSRSTRLLASVVALAIFTFISSSVNFRILGTASFMSSSRDAGFNSIPFHAKEILDECAALKIPAGPPKDFNSRKVSDRYTPGTPSTIIYNARIWTGEKNGTEVVDGFVWLEKGIVVAVGGLEEQEGVLKELRGSRKHDSLVKFVDAGGKWVTPGLVDLHSHLGVMSAPVLIGAQSTNSRKGPIIPWLRSIDGFNTHDDSFELTTSGGVTSAQVLPGSGNAQGGQAFVVKLRKTPERSPSSMVIEPPHSLNGSTLDPSLPPRWRHMKQACGENLRRYGNRMDSIWSFRLAYNEARKIKDAQDDYCRKAEAGEWDSLRGQDYPNSLQWEALVDVLRGRVKISNHCYEAVDLDNLVRITNEFKFNIASFHHAHEAYLVPEVLKKTYGGTPTIAVFAVHGGYKREAYRGSPFATRILADNDIPVVMKSDHPVTNSRYLLFEAQQAHYYGLPANLALASVTATPATAAGLSHRIGYLREGCDADVVLWDTHPLQLGATPVNVWIDGVLEVPVAVEKGGSEHRVPVGKGKEDPGWQEIPEVPNWDEERQRAIEWEGLPPLGGTQVHETVVFTNVSELWVRHPEHGIVQQFNGGFEEFDSKDQVVVVNSGRVACVGPSGSCTGFMSSGSKRANLRGGVISPGLTSFGSSLGLQEIEQEASTGPGKPYDALIQDVPGIVGDIGGVERASDALLFQTRSAFSAYEAGVTYAVVALDSYSGLIGGLSTTIRTGAHHSLEKGAIIQEVTALHVTIERDPWGSGYVSTSTQINVLRNLLLGSHQGVTSDSATGYWFRKVTRGEIPLVVKVDSVDIMATLLKLKAEVEDTKNSTTKLVFSGASESHLLAENIANANVGVILTSPRPYPATWDSRRILPGPPISSETTITKLQGAGVLVGIGVTTPDFAKNARFDLTWAGLESSGCINKRQAYALASTNLDKLLGIKHGSGDGDLVAFEGGSLFDLSSKVAAVVSPQRGLVDLF